MASSLLGVFCTVLVILAAINTFPVRASEEFKVGDAEGWQPPAVNQTQFYNHWAAKRRFHVGDSLRFEYKNDSVLVVDKWGYYHCNSSNPISGFNNGNTVVNLDKPGPIYFISGDPDHCKNGQQLQVEVINLLHPIPHTPSPSPISSSAAAVSEMVTSVLMPVIATLLWCSP